MTVLDQRGIYIVSLAGVALDALGGLYLAYDLFGGERGTLRTLTKACTYGVLVGLGFGVPLGRWFGLIGGFVIGPSVAVEFSARRHAVPRLESAAFLIVRAGSFGLAGALSVNTQFGLLLGFCAAALLWITEVIDPDPLPIGGIKPTRGISRRAMTAGALRGSSLALAAIISGVWAWQRDIALRGLEIAVVGGGLSAAIGATSPAIEWWADHLADRRLGAYGAALVVIGSLLQALQYLVPLIATS
jgi:hypothetical protein